MKTKIKCYIDSITVGEAILQEASDNGWIIPAGFLSYSCIYVDFFNQIAGRAAKTSSIDEDDENYKIVSVDEIIRVISNPPPKPLIDKLSEGIGFNSVTVTKEGTFQIGDVTYSADILKSLNKLQFELAERNKR